MGLTLLLVITQGVSYYMHVNHIHSVHSLDVLLHLLLIIADDSKLLDLLSPVDLTPCKYSELVDVFLLFPFIIMMA